MNPKSRTLESYVFLFLLCGIGISRSSAQPFTKITDSSNPIVTDSPSSGYDGASWIDYNNDGRLDLFVNRSFLYRNNGGGSFTKIQIHGIGSGLVQTLGSGNSWGDYDNDGNIDCFYSGGRSALYRGDGTGTFTQIRVGAVADTFASRGWACAWADYDNDGYLDLVITHPAGFVGTDPPTPNHLFHNDGPPNYTFTRIDTGVVVTGMAPYTVATWSDYDNDGDMDLFIGSGPATGVPAPDFLYKNMLKETNVAYFTRITTSPIATDPVDGQVWNWIDYDNDGDLDAYLTNYSGNGGSVGRANNLYRNDGSGVFTKITAAQVGSLVSDADFSLGNVWGDFDNDGDLDVFVSNDTGSPVRYYKNNGNGTFTRIDTGLVVTGTLQHSGISIGDYDNDGDLDVFIDGPSTARGLYRNDMTAGNGWVNLKLTGVQSNRTAIGAEIRAKARINGTAVWQRRDVSAQNSFNGANMLNVHFGFGNAPVIDSLIVTWPRGLVQTFTNVGINTFYSLSEGQGIILVGVDEKKNQLPTRFSLNQNYPNPFNPTTTIS
ncbi:MAG: CRTAC1 family protein, partial [bacterium]